MSHIIRQAEPADSLRLRRCLIESFDDDPIVNWFLRQDDGRDMAFAEFFRAAIDHMTLPFGEVYYTGDVGGVALWAPPGKWSLGLLDQLRLAPTIFRTVPRSVSSLVEKLWALQIMERHHLQEPHLYLSFLCSHPTARGQGIGAALLSDMQRKCRRQGLPIYLENTKEENEPFYRKFGFEVTGQVPLCRERPPYYAGMVWKPGR